MKINENKKTTKHVLKTYFLILNVIISIVAFSYLISAPTPAMQPLQSAAVPTSGQVVGAGATSATAPTAAAIGTAGGISPSPLPIEGPLFTPGLGVTGTGDIGLVGQGAGVATPAARTPAWEGAKAAMKEIFSTTLGSTIFYAAIGAGIGALIGTMAGGKNGASWGALAGSAGAGAGYLLDHYLASEGMKAMTANLWGIGLGLGLGLVIFLLAYKKESKKIVEFNCKLFEVPIGGANCEKCNNFAECSEYTCKSLGQACNLVNVGTKEQKCIWKDPKDVNSPKIETIKVGKDLTYKPYTSVRPPATGIEIQQNGGCVKAFTQIEFSISTKDSRTGAKESTQCKIDYNLTSDPQTAFNDMSYYMGGNNFFDYNHSEKLALPGPDAINKVAPEIKNDGTYTLYVRCMDANGNFNKDPYAVRFCVEKGPDTTPPKIENTSIPSESPINFNRTNLEIEVYVNEPSECKWSKSDRDYNNMENTMNCDLRLWEMNIDNRYACRVNLTGIESRKENVFYFRCKDKPDFEEKDRNVNVQSYRYVIVGTQPLNIIETGPSGTIKGATDVVPVTLSIKTDNGYKNGEAICYFKTFSSSSYIKFLETGGNEHKQRQDLVAGTYNYYFKCNDLGGNTAYNSTTFKVESDKSGPVVARAYKEIGQLKIKTNEEAECSYSNKDCNFEIDDGVKMATTDFKIHTSEWKININYYIRCKDKYNNQPNPNTCSIVVKPTIFSEVTAGS